MSQLSYDLTRLKRTLRGKSERIAIRDEIVRRWSPRPLEILDIGIGDGRFVERLLRLLELAGYPTKVCGIDPAVPSLTYPHIELIRDQFESCTLRKKFDVILATHSFYYLGLPDSALSKIHSLLRDDGMALVTLISEECILYRISCIAQHQTHVLSAEALRSTAKQLAIYARVSLRRISGTIRLEPWIRRHGLLRTACRMFSRDLDRQHISAYDLKAIQRTIKARRNEQTRVNGMVILTKVPRNTHSAYRDA